MGLAVEVFGEAPVAFGFQPVFVFGFGGELFSAGSDDDFFERAGLTVRLFEFRSYVSDPRCGHPALRWIRRKIKDAPKRS